MKIKHGFIVNGQSSFEGNIKGFDCKTEFKKTGSVTHRYDSVYSENQVNLEYKQVVKIEDFKGKIKYYSNTWCEEFTPKYWKPGKEALKLYGHGRVTSYFYPYLFIENKGEFCAFNLVTTGEWNMEVFTVGTTLNIVIDKGTYIPIKGQLPVCDEIFTVEGTDKNQIYIDQQNYVRKTYWHGGKVPSTYNTWIDQFNTLGWNNLVKQVDFQAELGTEVFIIDAGWFGRFGGWEDVGQWTEKENLFKNGKTLLDLANYIRSKGMKFGIWMEISKAHEKSDPYLNHPEYFIKIDCYDKYQPYYHYDFNNPEAMEFMYNEACKVIRKYGAKWVKFDNNHPRLRTEGDPHTLGALAYWEFLEKVKKTFPDLTIENCAGGGNTSDLQTISHHHTNAQTDTVYALSLLKMMSESFKVYPPCFANNWACLHPLKNTYTRFGKKAHDTTGMCLNPKDGSCTGMDAIPIDYAIAASFPGNFSMTGNFAEFGKKDRETIKKIVKIHRDYKDFIMNANYLQLESDRGLAFILTDNDYKNILLFIFENCEEPWVWAKNVKTKLNLIPKGKYDCVNLITGEKEELGRVYNKPFQYREVKIFKLTKK